MAGANTTYRLLNKVDVLSADFDFWVSVARKLEGDFAIPIFLRIGASFEPTSIFPDWVGILGNKPTHFGESIPRRYSHSGGSRV
jgi:hypothetical protein